MPDGSVILVEIKRQTLTRVHANGRKRNHRRHAGRSERRRARRPMGASMSATMAASSGSRSWDRRSPATRRRTIAADRSKRSISKTGAVETLYTEANGLRLSGPERPRVRQDRRLLVHRSRQGTLAARATSADFFTRSRTDRKSSKPRFRSSRRTGSVYRPTSDVLYVADTLSGRLLAFDLVGPGELAPSPIPIPGRTGGDAPRLSVSRQPRDRGERQYLRCDAAERRDHNHSRPKGRQNTCPSLTSFRPISVSAAPIVATLTSRFRGPAALPRRAGRVRASPLIFHPIADPYWRSPSCVF